MERMDDTPQGEYPARLDILLAPMQTSSREVQAQKEVIWLYGKESYSSGTLKKVELQNLVKPLLTGNLFLPSLVDIGCIPIIRRLSVSVCAGPQIFVPCCTICYRGALVGCYQIRQPSYFRFQYF